MSVKQISVFMENKPGALLNMTTVLAENRIDIRAFTLAETSDFGIVRIIVDDVYRASTALKDMGFVYSITNVLGVVIPDVPGGLNQVLQILTEEGVNVEYMYAFQGGKNINGAYMIFKVADEKKAAAVLTGRGIKLVDQEELETL
ncbi:MAG: ACT domain-containing protein [Eubacterium sp.]|nr:ACT domain-containing protein [Eubacterium sp.]